MLTNSAFTASVGEAQPDTGSHELGRPINYRGLSEGATFLYLVERAKMDKPATTQTNADKETY
ncbi:hypothetical protein GCM10027577_19050 [Spirosoma fluminis]